MAAKRVAIIEATLIYKVEAKYANFEELLDQYRGNGSIEIIDIKSYMEEKAGDSDYMPWDRA